MSGSLKLLAVRGIDIRLHYTFPLILIWAALQYGLGAGAFSAALFGVVAVTLLFFLVTLHELGHSFAAQQYGVPVRQIVLTPIGGMAQLERMPTRPKQELVIALAGPAVNLAVAVLMALALLSPAVNLTLSAAVLGGGAGLTFTALFSYLFVYNIFLGVFNLLPAFPMDGGRVLRSLLALRYDYARATTFAANVGRILAVLMGIFGFVNGQFFLMFIAFFIFAAAGQEAKLARVSSALRGYTVGQVYSVPGQRLGPQSSLEEASNQMFFGGQTTLPVVDGQRLLGLVDRARLLAAVQQHGPQAPVAVAMRRDVAPLAPADDLVLALQRLGAEQLEALPVVDGDAFLGLVSRAQIIRLHRLSRSTPNVIVQRPTG